MLVRNMVVRWSLAGALLLAAASPICAQGLGAAQHGTDYVAVGRSGAVAFTEDGGGSWTALEVTNAYINGVISDHRGRFFAVTSQGEILRSGNGGRDWEVAGEAAGMDLQAIAWDDAGTFVVVGEEGTLLVSTDDGTTWEPKVSGTDETLFSLATDRQGVWVVGGARGDIVRSTDGGETWMVTSTGSNGHIHGVASLGDGKWVGASLDKIPVYSSDDGASWSSANELAQPLSGVATDEAGTVVIVGWGGAIARSEDDGVTWTPVESGTTQRLEGIVSGGEGEFTAAGWRGTVTRSTDGGRTWSATEGITRRNLNEIAFNRLPDLALSGLRLDAECRVVVAVSNLGPATLPPESWDDESVALVVHGDEEPWGSLPLLSFDSDRSLELPGGTTPVTFDFGAVADSATVSVTMDPDGRVAEAREGNNALVAKLICSR